MKNRTTVLTAILLIAVNTVVILPSQVFAQTAAALGGRVSDSLQAVITGAEVTAANVETGVEARTTTNNAGVCNFANLHSNVSALF